MSETQTKTADEHLAIITERGGAHIEAPLRKRLGELTVNLTENSAETQTEHELRRPPSQETADYILSEIARLNKNAHAELGNSSSDNTVWLRSIEMVQGDIDRYLLEGNTSEAEQAMLTLLSMAALVDTESTADTHRRQGNYLSFNLEELLYEGRPGTREVLEHASHRADELGLCLDLSVYGVQDLIPISRFANHELKNYDLNQEFDRVENERQSRVDELIAMNDSELLEAICAQQSMYDIFTILKTIPLERAQGLVMSSQGELHDRLKKDATEGSIGTHSILTDLFCYIKECNALELKKIADESDDEIIGNLTRRPEYGDKVLKSLNKMSESKHLWLASDFEEYNGRLKQWTSDYVKMFIGLPEDLAELYEDVICSRTSTEEWHGRKPFKIRDTEKVTKALMKLQEIVSQLGVDNIVKLQRGTGIVNFDNYEPHQLERMLRLMSGDGQLIEKLQNSDLTAVLIDGRGDHNGALATVPAVFEQPSENTVFFEVHQQSDLYRYPVILRRLGLAESTLVLAAHGFETGMTFGDESNYFAVGNSSGEDDASTDLNIGKASGISHIVKKYMKKDKYGRKRVILYSCSVGGTRSKLTIGEGNLQRNDKKVAISEAFVKQADDPDLDVYAGTQEILAQEGTGEGYLRFFSPNGRPIMKRFSVGVKGGQVSSESIDKLELY